MNLFDNIGRASARGGQYDVICFGHKRQFEFSSVGRTQIINPGEIYGGLTGHSTFVLYDTATGKVERLDL